MMLSVMLAVACMQYAAPGAFAISWEWGGNYWQCSGAQWQGPA